MSDTSRTRNLHFFSHLLNTGIIDDEQFEAMCEKLAESDEKHILFQISNFFANFTASDWFDLSCRIHNNWQRFPPQSQGTTPISNHFAQYPNSARDNGEYGSKRKGTNQDSVPDSFRAGERRNLTTGNVVKTETRQWEPIHQQKYTRDDPKFITPNKPNLSDQAKEKYLKQSEVNAKISNRTSLSEMKRSVSPKGTENRTPKNKTSSQQQKKERVSGDSGDKDPHARLYYDFFQKRANMEIKREMKKTNELENCTFIPQVNPVDTMNYALVNTLRVPVYDRLNQAKFVPDHIMLEKQEYKELKGATFHPDISKSQKSTKSRQDQASSPENRKQEAVERLYGDAQIKERILSIKQMSRKEQEIEGCTFSPKVLSPQKDKENFLKNHLSKSIDRLYDENLKRHRKLLKKEVEFREQEMEECTFQPERAARNYRTKDNDLNDLAAHDRLYERFKRKQLSVNNSFQELYDGSARKSQRRNNSRSHRSHSAAPEKSIRSPKDYSENNEVNTPAFDRLYKDMIKRKLKMEQLKERVNREEGITFKPKTNPRKSKRSESRNRSHQDIKLTPFSESSKVVDGAYLKNNPYQGRRESDNLLSNGIGGNYDGYGSNPGRR